MLTSTPGKTTITTLDGIPSGADVGFQVIKAATNLVTTARTTAGVSERPLGTGNFVITFIAPQDDDLYLLVVDWSGGVLTQETSKVIDLQVSADVQIGATGLGVIADYARIHLGGESWAALQGSVNFGPSSIAVVIALVKARVLTTPPPTDQEGLLHPLLLEYLGICVALDLVIPARDHWGSIPTSKSTGDDPAENVTFANRVSMMNELRDDLLRRVSAAQAAALPVIDGPNLQASSSGPEIDEDDDYRVTEDPRDFPPARSFPGYGGFNDDSGIGGLGYPRRSGVRL